MLERGEKMKIGDLVVRKKYHKDIVFEIYHLTEQLAYLKGVEIRLLADSPLSDLEPASYVSEPVINESRLCLDEKVLKGKILHLDGDRRYLEMCLKKYQELGVRAVGAYVKEEEMPLMVINLLERHQPDLLVITGHDAMNEEKKYSHSQDFASATRQARRYQNDKDRLIIFAGACQSDYEGLIAAGANFASSPARVNIHALDPVYLMSQVASVNVRNYVDIERITENTSCRVKGIGGIDTKGVARKVYPCKENV